MTIKLTMPQADLLESLRAAGEQGVFKSQANGAAASLVRDGLACWKRKHFGGTGTLVITEHGKRFGTGK